MDPKTRMKVLSDMAKEKANVNHNVAPRTYLRSAVQIEKQARSYYEDEDWVSAYILYVRFCHLVLQELPTHPKYKTVPKEEKDQARNKIKVMLERAEEVKVKLDRIFTAEYEQRMREEQRQMEEQKLREHQQEMARQQLLQQQRKEQEEKERRRLEQQRQDEIATAAATQQTITPGPSLERDGPHTSPQFGNNSNTFPSEWSNNSTGMNAHVIPLGGVTTSHMMPPGGVSTSHMVPPGGLSTSHSIPPGGVASAHMMPPGGVSSYNVMPPGGVSPVVDRSNKPAHLIQQETHPQDHITHPIVDRSTKPKMASHDPMADMFLKGIETLQATGGLRMVHLPHNIDHNFLAAASSNTRRNVETCGTLAGKLSKNVLHITHLIIPRQEGTPDSCVTLNEEEILEVLEKYDLISLGWIHTHPSQTSFLSSIDMHMQFSYQVMLDEAIAIVVAPKYTQVGYYCLTSQGLDVIGNCQQTGFHPHSKHPPLFEDCKHVHFNEALTLRVIDLRR